MEPPLYLRLLQFRCSRDYRHYIGNRVAGIESSSDSIQPHYRKPILCRQWQQTHAYLQAKLYVGATQDNITGENVRQHYRRTRTPGSGKRSCSAPPACLLHAAVTAALLLYECVCHHLQLRCGLRVFFVFGDYRYLLVFYLHGAPNSAGVGPTNTPNMQPITAINQELSSTCRCCSIVYAEHRSSHLVHRVSHVHLVWFGPGCYCAST